MTGINLVMHDKLLTQLKQQPASVEFSQVMQVINDNYRYQATCFTNGDVVNQAGENEGSCKIFYFAKLHELNEEQTLACFGQYYRDDVLSNSEGKDHANIRNFIVTGWQGVAFTGVALLPNDRKG